MTAVARDSDVSHATAAPGGFPGQLADARFPAHMRLARPQLVTERASRWSSGQLTHDRQLDRSRGWLAETTAAVLVLRSSLSSYSVVREGQPTGWRRGPCRST
jgi:hypothetical protein